MNIYKPHDLRNHWHQTNTSHLDYKSSTTPYHTTRTKTKTIDKPCNQKQQFITKNIGRSYIHVTIDSRPTQAMQSQTLHKPSATIWINRHNHNHYKTVHNKPVQPHSYHRYKFYHLQQIIRHNHNHFKKPTTTNQPKSNNHSYKTIDIQL